LVSEADSGVREGEAESSHCAGSDLDWRWSMTTGLIDDPEPRGLGLKLVVADFSEQNHGLGLHGALLSLVRSRRSPLAVPSIVAPGL
jgi:hypothetical protein